MSESLLWVGMAETVGKRRCLADSSTGALITNRAFLASLRKLHACHVERQKDSEGPLGPRAGGRCRNTSQRHISKRRYGALSDGERIFSRARRFILNE